MLQASLFDHVLECDDDQNDQNSQWGGGGGGREECVCVCVCDGLHPQAVSHKLMVKCDL